MADLADELGGCLDLLTSAAAGLELLVSGSCPKLSGAALEDRAARYTGMSLASPLDPSSVVSIRGLFPILGAKAWCGELLSADLFIPDAVLGDDEDREWGAADLGIPKNIFGRGADAGAGTEKWCMPPLVSVSESPDSGQLYAYAGPLALANGGSPPDNSAAIRDSIPETALREPESTISSLLGLGEALRGGPSISSAGSCSCKAPYNSSMALDKGEDLARASSTSAPRRMDCEAIGVGELNHVRAVRDRGNTIGCGAWAAGGGGGVAHK